MKKQHIRKIFSHTLFSIQILGVFMLPKETPHMTVVHHFNELMLSIKDNSTYLSFCPLDHRPKSIVRLLNALAKSSTPFLMKVRKFQKGSDYIYLYGSNLNNLHRVDSKTNFVTKVQEQLKVCMPTITTIEAKRLSYWLVNELINNIEYIPQEEPLFSYITNCNEDSLKFTQTWHPDNNGFVLISHYAGDTTRFLKNDEEYDFFHHTCCSPILNGKPDYYHLPKTGKTLHKGYRILGLKAPLHMSPCTQHRLIGITATL